MKKIFLTLIILLSIGSTALADTPNDTIDRFYNRYTGEHLFTNADEYGEWYNLYTFGGSAGWVREGYGWRSPAIGYGEPVYRLYNAAVNEHIYTKDQNEINVLKSRGWTVDFGGKVAFCSGGSVPIYRLYHPGIQKHHLTTDANEYNTLPAHGWTQEGVAFTALQVGFVSY